ncbi:MAG TPA: NADPH-dependent F420 reductase [Candidatus Bathyarchaeia archaeon]|nr:NADPH-dependent F420 reductase [Candidatus Bathyarchaeia archaeon]
MKIGILGGTGNMGRGLTIRWALKHDILVGSRSLDKARLIAKEQENVARGFYQADFKGSIKGALNSEAVVQSDIVVVTLPAEAVVPAMKELKRHLQPNQIIVSTVVSMKKSKGLFVYTPLSEVARERQEKSAAEVIQEIVNPVPVVSAFQTVPATYLNNIDSVMNIDVLVASNHNQAFALASKLISDIPNLRPLKVGPLENSKLIESLTPLLLNAAILNNLQDPSIRVVPWMPASFEE